MDPLVEEVVSTPQDVVDLLEKGNNGRKIGATDWVSGCIVYATNQSHRMNARPDLTAFSPSLSSRGREMETMMRISDFRD